MIFTKILKYRISTLTLIFVIFTYSCCVLLFKLWNNPQKVIQWDVKDYYAYLPAVFIYKDVTLKFKEQNPSYFSERIWGKKLDNGNYVLKFYLGTSIMYLPLFLIAHVCAQMFDYVADGYTVPYAASIVFSALLYFIISLIVLRKILLRYFSDTSVAIVLLLLSFATNLTHYVLMEPGMTHVYSFFLYVLLIYFTIKFYDSPTLLKSLIIGLILALVSVVRPTNVVVALIFLLWNISNFEQFKKRILFFIEKYYHLVAILIVFVLIWLLQLNYWKHVTGSWLYYPYGEEGFFFLKPKILEVLFSFRKGLFIYTPVMVLAFLGFFYLWSLYRILLIPLVIFTILNMYIISSWWCWWYGGSFGLRAFIESYAVMSLPLAALTERFIIRKSIKHNILIWFVSVFFILLNIFYQCKYNNNSIHYDSMTRHSWIETIDKFKPTSLYYQLLQTPDYENAVKGKLERYIPFQFGFLFHSPDHVVVLHEQLLDTLNLGRQFKIESEFPAGTSFNYEQISKLQALILMIEYQSFTDKEEENLLLVCSVENNEHVKWYRANRCIYYPSESRLKLCAFIYNGYEGSYDDIVKCYIWNKDKNFLGTIRWFRILGIY